MHWRLVSSSEARMSRANWKFTPTDVKRAIASTESAGLTVRGVEIGTQGEIRLTVDKPSRPATSRTESAPPKGSER
jgi:hypothetical protein